MMMMTRPLRILLVEDDDAQAKIVELALESSPGDCTLRRVSDGDAAIATLRGEEFGGGGRMPVGHRPDLVLLDLKLPKRDGFEVLEEIKNDPVLRLIPVVVLSTSRAERDRMRAYERHANSYVTKPHNFDEFVRLLQDISLYWSHWNEPVQDDL